MTQVNSSIFYGILGILILCSKYCLSKPICSYPIDAILTRIDGTAKDISDELEILITVS